MARVDSGLAETFQYLNDLFNSAFYALGPSGDGTIQFDVKLWDREMREFPDHLERLRWRVKKTPRNEIERIISECSDAVTVINAFAKSSSQPEIDEVRKAREAFQRIGSALHRVFLVESGQDGEIQEKDGQEAWGKAGDKEQTTPETKPDSTAAQIVNIQNYGTMGNVQAESVQTGNDASIHKHDGIEKKEIQEGSLEPKAPESLQKLLWIWKHGRKHWKLILSAIAIFLIWSILAKFDLMSRFYTLIKDMCS